MNFQSKKIHRRVTKINGKIKKATNEYRKNKVPMKLLLTNFLAVKSKNDYMAKAENPWAYLYKGIKGHEVESGVSVDETLFRFATMEIKDELPADVINAAFYANKKRNDDLLELEYLLPYSKSFLESSSNVLIVNPSPNLIMEIQEYNLAKVNYAVVDETIKALYQLQFPKSNFLTFYEIPNLMGVDFALIVNRDQKSEMAAIFLKSLECCVNEDSKIVACVPNVWFDNFENGNYFEFEKNGFYPKEMLLIDTNFSSTTPKKKMIVTFDKQNSSTFSLFNSSFNKEKEMLFVDVKNRKIINNEEYFLSKKSIISLYKNDKELQEKKYSKAKEYAVSREISIFYKIYTERKNKYAGVAHYKKLKQIDPKLYGVNLSGNIEKNLRKDTPEEIVIELENIVFNVQIHPHIKNDIFELYLSQKKSISLKSLWIYLWDELKLLKNYDHDVFLKLFKITDLSFIDSSSFKYSEVSEIISKVLDIDMDEMPPLIIEQFYYLFQIAVKNKIIFYNVFEIEFKKLSNRATKRQQDVRDTLVKKHFSDEEEKKIFKSIVGKNPLQPTTTTNSLNLAVAIRYFTGISVGEVCAIKWKDYKNIDNTEYYKIEISKNVDSNGNINSHISNNKSRRFRFVPVPVSLAYLLNLRKQYLFSCGLDEETLLDQPIVMLNEKNGEVFTTRNSKYCLPRYISEKSKKIIQELGFNENTVILPDENGGLETDLNLYHGDIFLSNFRTKANKLGLLNLGEINYLTGIKLPDTFSTFYCDFSNDLIQIGMIRKLRRWDNRFIDGNIPNTMKSKKGDEILNGKFEKNFDCSNFGAVSVEMLIDLPNSADLDLNVESNYGHTIFVSKY